MIWKSRGEYEYYNVVEDPLEVNNLYSKDNEKAENMNRQLASYFKSLHYIPQIAPDVIGHSTKENLELMKRLRGIGYIK